MITNNVEPTTVEKTEANNLILIVKKKEKKKKGK